MMKTMMIAFGVTTMLAGCSAVTDINKLTPPPATKISGKVLSKDGDEFVLQDETGKVEVEATDASVATLVIGETIYVYGNLDEDDLGEFDAYRIVKADGTEMRLLEQEE